MTLHERHAVLCSRTIRNAGRADETSLRAPDGRQPTSVMASVYNRLRQRSDPVTAELPRS
ncbi:MAG: hypothetical protein ICV69_03515 [Thermoleophilaceae bacterium]|nr:hypothetical protein [Thermoleophilaceae bacterium]